MSDEQASWLKDMQFARDVTLQVSAELENLATHLHVVGMTELALRLERKVACLDGAGEAIERGLDAKLSADLVSARQATANMLGAALAMVKEEKREHD